MTKSVTYDPDEGISNLIEYLMITSTLVILMLILMLSIYPVFFEGPVYQLRSNSFLDIGNGVSTRIVDLYVIAPDNGAITSKFDIPNDVAGKGYFVDIITRTEGKDVIIVSGDNIREQISLAGIGATIGVGGNTSSSGLNEIYYSSAGV
jgi:hypothetical protein